MKLKFLFILIVLCLLGYGIYAYIYHGGRDYANELSVKVKSTSDVFNDFQKDETKANSQYLNKVIELEGRVTNVDKVNFIIVIDEKLVANIDSEEIQMINKGNKIRVKGRLIGYDELLEELKIDNCTIIK